MNKYTQEQIDFILGLDEWEVHFIKELNDKLPTLRYISGYTGSESKVLLQCKKCGELFTRTATLIRKQHYEVFKCNGCAKLEKKEKQKQRYRHKQIKQMIDEYNKSRNKEINKIYKMFRNNTIYIRKCVECNEEYIGQSKSKYCPHCRKTIRKKHSGKSLRKLYERDKGICQLCHTKCNWNDKQVINGTTIVGKTYPSIDHIIPLSKGGSDDWENLQLAHFKCNLVKGACLEN